MDTILTKNYPVSKEDFEEYVFQGIKPYVQSCFDDISSLIKEIHNFFQANRSVYIPEMDIYLDTKLKILLPNLEQFEVGEVDNLESFIPEKFAFDESGTLNYMYELPKVSLFRQKKNLLTDIYGLDSCFVCICDDKRYTNYIESVVAYFPEADRVLKAANDMLKFNLLKTTNYTAKLIPVVNLEYDNEKELIVEHLIASGLYFDGLPEKADNCFRDLILCYKYYPGCVKIASDGKICFGAIRRIIKDYLAGDKNEWIKKLHWEFMDVLEHYNHRRCIGGADVDIRSKLLNCEKSRADIEPYEERLLTDPNRGHWDLWVDQDDASYTIEVGEELIARNPASDVNENGVIAIDFGTKSTIVVYQGDIEHSLPMGIGDGNLSKEPSAKRYENPTVMHFVDLASFLDDYNEKEGRPNTKWNDLTISHTAIDQFANSKSEEYYEYLHQIKQWAGQRKKQFRIISHDGSTYELPAFIDLKEDELNPIEIYAYYIGLYINNMRKGHGIYLDYYLSFPVTYETKIREKIVKSFEKGLKKSLPVPILKNDKMMERFHVNGDISEPAAYAVCALQEYGFEPEGDDEYFYGIFDFGGGTTDFDFGLWKQSTKKRYDFTIENFGAGGDAFLGGENLLEMIAFEVFKANQALMREKGYTFTLAPKCTEFIGSDSLIASSQEAEKNMHNLMEKIRPYWEGQTSKSEHIGEAEQDIDALIVLIEKLAVSHPKQAEIEQELADVEKLIDSELIDSSMALTNLEHIINDYKINLNSDDDVLKFVVDLFDKEGKDHPNEILYFSHNMLDDIIESRIKEGVDNFFSALMLSYHNGKVKKPTTVNILLAGNSCKSPVVKKVFEEEIAKREKEIREENNCKDYEGKFFDIFPPLGTEDAYKKMEERGLVPCRGDFEKPTGKTGVAFGLIECREGGSIERITNIGIEEEIPFHYFIGWRSRKKFKLFKDDSKLTKNIGKPDYNEWYKFIEADAKVFDLFYTTLPECVNGELIVDGNAAVKRLRCEIDTVDDNAYVFIRAVDPHTLEYVVAKDDNIDTSKMGEIVRKELQG